MLLRPVPRQSLADAVYGQLRDQIVSGVLLPGAELPAERALVAQLDVNRGAVREALQRLEQARLVRIRHGGATEVLDWRDHAGTALLEELITSGDDALRLQVARGVVGMRALIGPDIARLAALHADADALAQIEARVQDIAAAPSTLDRQRAALRFWGALVRAADNLAYRLAYNSLREAYVQLMPLLSPLLADEVADDAGFGAILAAVVARSPEAAEAAARALLSRGTTSLTLLLDALPSPGSPLPTRAPTAQESP